MRQTEKNSLNTDAMYFKKDEEERGDYLRTDGVRFVLQQARRVRPADDWTVFESLEACLAAWELTYAPLPEPPVLT